MTYGYVRVSTDKQRVDNQEYEIQRFCKKNNIVIDEWIKETISGTKTPDKRKLGALLDRVKSGDLIICAELSRLGRTLFMIMSILNRLMAIDAKVWTIKDNYRLGDDIQSKVLAFAFGLAAEIERDLISQRTKEALALRVAEGVIMGRPRGTRNKTTKLTHRTDEIITLLKQGHSYSKIAKELNVARGTITQFCIDNDLLQYREFEKTDKRALFRGKQQQPKFIEQYGFNELKRAIKAGLTIAEMEKKYNVSHHSIRRIIQNNEILFNLYRDYHSKVRAKHNVRKT